MFHTIDKVHNEPVGNSETDFPYQVMSSCAGNKSTSLLECVWSLLSKCQKIKVLLIIVLQSLS